MCEIATEYVGRDVLVSDRFFAEVENSCRPLVSRKKIIYLHAAKESPLL